MTQQMSGADIGATNVTTLGTITTGTWNATPVTVTYGGTGDASFTAYSVLCGGTTSTGALQNVSGVGTSGQVLTSNGASALPTWQNTGSGSSGVIIQVVQGTLTSTASSASSTFADTGLSVSITPASSSHKVLVMAFINAANNIATDASVFLNLVRNSTNLLQADAAGSRTSTTTFLTAASSGTAGMEAATILYLDSPASTSAVTYKIQFAASDNAGTVYINQSTTDANSSNYGRAASSIIVMEVTT